MCSFLRLGIVFIGLCGTPCALRASTDGQGTDLGVLAILSMHRMSEAEIRENPDDSLGARVAITLRYESPKNRGVFLYAPPDCPPEGYLLRRDGREVVWVAALVNGIKGSPGFRKLKHDLGVGWIFLPPNSAIEWQIRTWSTSPGSENAWSIFVRFQHKKTTHEVLSSWFRTPDAK